MTRALPGLGQAGRGITGPPFLTRNNRPMIFLISSEVPMKMLKKATVPNRSALERNRSGSARLLCGTGGPVLVFHGRATPRAKWGLFHGASGRSSIHADTVLRLRLHAPEIMGAQGGVWTEGEDWTVSEAGGVAANVVGPRRRAASSIRRRVQTSLEAKNYHKRLREEKGKKFRGIFATPLPPPYPRTQGRKGGGTSSMMPTKLLYGTDLRGLSAGAAPRRKTGAGGKKRNYLPR